MPWHWGDLVFYGNRNTYELLPWENMGQIGKEGVLALFFYGISLLPSFCIRKMKILQD